MVTNTPPMDSDALHRLAFDNADQALILMDPGRRILAWNMAAERLFLLSSWDMVGRSADAIFTPEDRAAGAPDEEARIAVEEGGAPDRRWHVKGDGSRFWAEGRLSTLRDPAGGRLLGFVKNLEDRTRDLAIEDRMRAEHALLQQLLEQLPVGVAIAEVPSGRLLFHNQEAVRLLGHPLLESDDYKGYARYGALHPDGTPYRPDEYPIARAVLAGETLDREAMAYRRGDGVITRFEVSAAPVRQPDGTVTRAVSTFQDTSARFALEETLRIAAEREKLLAREASHRVKNSLQLVSSLLSLQASGAREPGVRQALRDASGRVATIARLHNRLWREEKSHSVRLDDFLIELCGELQALGTGHRVTCLALEPVEASPDIAAPAGLIVTELASNAMKHAFGDGVGVVAVLLSPVPGGTSFRLEVRDRGRGLPDAFDIDRVAREAGSLGMRLVTALVEQGGGSIQVERAEPGTRFVVELPLSLDHGTP